MNCPKCGNIANKNGSKNGKQKYICRTCKFNFERPKEIELSEESEQQSVGLVE